MDISKIVGFERFSDYEPQNDSPFKKRVEVDPLAEFRTFIQNQGFILEGPPEFDRWMYCRTTYGAKSKKKAWYRLSRDDMSGALWAVYGDWTESDESNTWYCGKYRSLDVFERKKIDASIEKARKERSEQIKKDATEAASKGRELVEGLPIATKHPYLEKKGVKAHGIKYNKQSNTLIIPMRDAKGDFKSYQSINAEGKKLYCKGGQKAGAFFQFGHKLTNPIYICEGWATGATIYEATKKTVIVAFDAGNIEPVTKTIRQQTASQIIIAADNDHAKDKNTGVETALKVAESVPRVDVIYPQDIEGTDYNDLYSERGIDGLCAALGVSKIERPYELIDPLNAPPVQAIDYVVEDFIVAGTYSILWGVDGTGKSMLVQDMALSIATGKKWAGREVKQGAVLYVMGEGHPDMQNRITAWRKHYKMEGTPFHIRYTSQGANLTDPAIIEQIRDDIAAIEAATGVKVVMIVVDTLSTNFGDGSEKDDKDARALVKPLIRLGGDTGAAVLVVHHANKSGDGGASGSRLFQGDAYTKLEVKRPNPKKITLKTHKIKSGIEPDQLEFDIHTVSLGQVIDHKGRSVDTSAPVVEYSGRAEFSAESIAALAANQTQNDAERAGAFINSAEYLALTKNQKIVMDALLRIAQQQKNNTPGRETYQVLQTDLIKILGEEIPKATRWRALETLDEMGIIDKNGAQKYLQFAIKKEHLL